MTLINSFMTDLLILLSCYIVPRWSIVKEIFQNILPEGFRGRKGRQIYYLLIFSQKSIYPLFPCEKLIPE